MSTKFNKQYHTLASFQTDGNFEGLRRSILPETGFMADRCTVS